MALRRRVQCRLVGDRADDPSGTVSVPPSLEDGYVRLMQTSPGRR